MNSFNEVFNAVKEYCKQNVVLATYNLFFADIEPVDFDGNTATLQVRTDFVKNTIENRYPDLIPEAFRTILGFEPNLVFVLPSAQPAPSAAPVQQPDGN